jgi:hypothetical protein
MATNVQSANREYVMWREQCFQMYVEGYLNGGGRAVPLGELRERFDECMARPFNLTQAHDVGMGLPGQRVDEMFGVETYQPQES